MYINLRWFPFELFINIPVASVNNFIDDLAFLSPGTTSMLLLTFHLKKKTGV